MYTTTPAREATPATMKIKLSIVPAHRRRGFEPVLTISTPARIEATLALINAAVWNGVMAIFRTRFRRDTNVGGIVNPSRARHAFGSVWVGS